MAQGNLEYAREVVTRHVLAATDSYVAYHIRQGIALCEMQGNLEAGKSYLQANLSPRYRQQLSETMQTLQRAVDERKALDKNFDPKDPRWAFDPLPTEAELTKFSNRWQAIKYIESVLPGLNQRLKAAESFGDDAQAVRTAITMLRSKQQELMNEAKSASAAGKQK